MELQYLRLLENVLRNGTDKPVFGHKDKFVRSLFGAMLRFDMRDGSIPIYTTKRVFYRGAFEEMLWFLEGTGDVVQLHNKKVFIWDDWAAKALNITVEDFAAKVESGEITECKIPLHYTNGTNWDGSLNQFDWAVEQIKAKPYRKSYLVNFWNPATVYHMADATGNESVCLPACHYSHQVVVNDGQLSLMVNIRSNDLLLGNPFNVSQYAMLLRMYCHLTGFLPGDLVVSIGDAHIYSDHFAQAWEQISRVPRPFPKLEVIDNNQTSIQGFKYSDFKVTGYDPHAKIKADITVVGGY